MSVVTAHMVYFYAFAHSEIFQKTPGNLGWVADSEAGVNVLSPFPLVYLSLTTIEQKENQKVFSEGRKGNFPRMLFYGWLQLSQEIGRLVFALLVTASTGVNWIN